MRLSDLPRADDRAIINRTYNGEPPWEPSKAEENGVQINRNFLEAVNLMINASNAWENAFLKPGNFFTVTVDSGPGWKRGEWGRRITTHINRALKRRLDQVESERAVGSSTLIHGVGPSFWANKHCPVPRPLSMGSLLIPSETDIDFENLEYFFVFREWTPSQLYDMTHGPRVDPGWDMKVVNTQFREIANKLRKDTNATAYQYMPEKIVELVKQDKGFWGSDAVPTVDVWDGYFREAEDGKGWYRRILLDWGIAPSRDGGGGPPSDSKNKDGFIYTSGKRKYANKLSELLHCQFGNVSRVPPFKYHSQRGLGWMLWGVADLQNRLRCRFHESVFEQMLWFFRTASNEQFTRLKKAMFHNMAVIPQGIEFITADQRFKPDAGLVELALNNNRQLMAENAASYTQDYQIGEEETATGTMAKVNQVNQMVSSVLNRAYTYERFKDIEIARRFCIKDSKDPDVKKFRLACLKDGVPEEMLDVDRWNVEPERVLGGGDKTAEIAQATALFQTVRPVCDPEGQQVIDHMFIEANSDAALAEQLKPLDGMKHISDATHDAQLAAGALMMGLPVDVKVGLNHRDYIEALMRAMATVVHKIETKGGMATADEIQGLQNIANLIGQHMQILAQDKEEKQRVKEYGDELGQIMNAVKAYAQRLQEQQQAQAEQNGQPQVDPKDMAKIQAMLITAKAKADNTRESHAQRTAQRQVQFDLQQKQKEQEHKLNMRRKVEEQQVSDLAEGLKTSAEVQRKHFQSFSE